MTRVVLTHVGRGPVVFPLQGFEHVQFGGQEAVCFAVTQHQHFVWNVMRVYTPQKLLCVLRVTLSHDYYLIEQRKDVTLECASLTYFEKIDTQWVHVSTAVNKAGRMLVHGSFIACISLFWF